MKNKLLKFLCINLSVCFLAVSTPVTELAYANAGVVKSGKTEEVAETETDMIGAEGAVPDIQSLEDTRPESIDDEKGTGTEGAASEAGNLNDGDDTGSELVDGGDDTGTEASGEEESADAEDAGDNTEAENPSDGDDAGSENPDDGENSGAETPGDEDSTGAEDAGSEEGIETEDEEDTETEDAAAEDAEADEEEEFLEETEEKEELSAEKSVRETAAETDEDLVFKQELLQKVQKYYPQMYINEDGLFEYIDETGTKHIYDPYDPEFAKYMLAEELVATEREVDNNTATAAGEDNTTVSPFTGKTYTHESHVSGMVIRHGIDVSKYQGNIDWAKAKAAGVEFAIVRVGFRGYGSAGNIAGDAYAVQNIKNAYAAGVEVGIYFFSQAITEAEAQEEALYCYNFLKDNGLQDYITMPVFIDYEYSPTGTSGRLYDANLSNAQRQAICDKFVNTIKEYGYEPGIYANYSMLTDDMQPAKSSAYSYTNYWIARYNNATKYSNQYSFWQYSSQGTVDGITVNTVDCNFWYDEQKELSDPSIQISISDECDYLSDIKELLTIYDSGKKYTLVEGTDYTAVFSEETEEDAKIVSIEITGLGVYQGTITKRVKMTSVSLSAEMVSEIPSQTFTGKEITTAEGLPVVLHHAGETLEEGKDYTLSYENNTNVGTATVKITGMGNYSGEIEKSFQIEQMTLASEMLAEIPDVTYTGSKMTTATGVALTISNPNTGVVLTEGTDYTVAYTSNQKAGTAKVTITGKGNYKGKLTTAFAILKKSIGDGSFVLDENVEITIGGEKDVYAASYTGKAIKPSVTVTVDGVLLKKSDYEVTYTNNVQISEEAYVTIKGKGNYEGSVKKCFTIKPKAAAPVKLTSKMVSLESTCIRATGSSIWPEVCVVQNGTVLTEGTDYTISITDSKKNEVTEIIEAGTYNIKVKGTGSYTGEVTQKLQVISADKNLIGKAYTDVTFVSEEDFVYTGKAIKPEVKVIDKTLDGQELKKGVDYTISYTDNTKAGVARYTITGKGKYTGTYTGTFTIAPVELGSLVQEQEGSPIEAGDLKISLNKYQFSYNGKAQKPTITVKYGKQKLKENTDFEAAFTAAYAQENAIEKKNADTYQLSITFKGNYAGTAALSYQISPVDVSKLSISVPKQQYTGNAVCPALSDMTVKIGSTKLDESALKGLEIISWTNNTAVSKGSSKAGFTIVVTEENANFVKDTVKNVSFTISTSSIADSTLAYTLGGLEVTGSSSALELVYNNGTAFDQTNGAELCITDTLTGNVLQEGIDYTLKYSNNKNVGTAKVKVSGTGGYKGSKTISFKIIGKPIGNGQANEGYSLVMKESEADGYLYSGKAISPQVQLYEGDALLQKNEDYTVKYENNVNAGEAAVILTGKGKYSGTIRQSYTIKAKSRTDANTIQVNDIPDQKYTGKVIVPALTVKVDGKTLKKGKDYTVSVINSTRLNQEDSEGKKGTATVFITGTGNYKGVLAQKTFVVRE